MGLSDKVPARWGAPWATCTLDSRVCSVYREEVARPDLSTDNQYPSFGFVCSSWLPRTTGLRMVLAAILPGKGSPPSHPATGHKLRLSPKCWAPDLAAAFPR